MTQDRLPAPVAMAIGLYVDIDRESVAVDSSTLLGGGKSK